MIESNDSHLNDDFLQNEKFKNLIFKSSNTVSEFISIQEGFDKFCSFCVYFMFSLCSETFQSRILMIFFRMPKKF